MNDEIRKVSWLELFYDLSFVALVAQLTYVVSDHHKTLIDLFHVGLVGYMIFLAWIGTTVSRNINKTETKKDKLLIQLQMVLAFLMSLTLPGVFEGVLMPFFLSYALIKSVQLYSTHIFYIENPEEKPKTMNVFWGTFSGTVLWCVAGFVSLPFAYIVATMALTIDILTPLTQGKGNSKRLLNISHLQERLGLFLILVIGESMLVVALANTVTSLDAGRPGIVFSGIILMIALWWSYFGYLEKCGEGRRPKNMFLHLHSHAFLFGGVILLSAAYKNFLKHEELLFSDQILLTVGLVIITSSMFIIRKNLETRYKVYKNIVLIMTAGIPIISYVGYQTNEITYSLILMTVWVALLSVFDELKRG